LGIDRIFDLEKSLEVIDLDRGAEDKCLEGMANTDNAVAHFNFEDVVVVFVHDRTDSGVARSIDGDAADSDTAVVFFDVDLRIDIVVHAGAAHFLINEGNGVAEIAWKSRVSPFMESSAASERSLLVASLLASGLRLPKMP
jgi:hypothetical protein